MKTTTTDPCERDTSLPTIPIVARAGFLLSTLTSTRFAKYSVTMGLGQTITVVNRSGKIVSTGKHLTNVFNEAKSAYLDRKAQLADERSSKAGSRPTSGRSTPAQSLPPRPTLEERKGSSRSKKGSSRRTSSQDDTRTVYYRGRESDNQTVYHRGRDSDNETVYQRGRESDTSTIRQSSRCHPERGYSDSFYESDGPASKSMKRTSTAPLTASNLRNVSTASSTTPTTPTRQYSSTSIERSELLRRRSDTDLDSASTIRPTRARAHSPTPSDDSNLAYGDMPPPLPMRTTDAEAEIRTKMSALQLMLTEANCVQHSAKAVIKNLQENPDAMAAVALTLAEISNLATKMAPGALMSLKGAFPMVIALLLSPEFLIAGGVAIGVTVVSFGGYKIIKKMKLKKGKKLKDGESSKESSAEEEEDDELELEELSQIDRIEQWRRGLQLPPGMDDTTSVEGEFATPEISKKLREEGVLEPKKEKPKDKKEKEKGKKDKDLVKREKDLQQREKALEKREADLQKATEKNEKLERKATESDRLKTQKMERKAITHGADAEADAQTDKTETKDVQKLLKTIFSRRDKDKKEVKGEVVA